MNAVKKNRNTGKHIDENRSRKYFEKIFESEGPTDTIFLVDKNGAFVKTSPGFNALLGYETGELDGHKFIEVVHRDEKVDKLIPDVTTHYFLRSSEIPMNMHFIDKAGGKIPVCLHSVVIENRLGGLQQAMGFVEYSKDSEKEFQDRIFEARQNLKSVLENSGDGIFVCNANGYITLVNDAFAKMVGSRKEEIKGKHLFDITPLDGTFNDTLGNEVVIDDNYMKHQVERANELFEKGKVTYRLYLAHSSGKIVPVEGTFSILHDQHEERRGTIGIVRNATDRIRAERQLAQSRDYLENIFKTTADGIIVIDEWGEIVRANKSIEKMFGCPEKKLLGKHTTELIPKRFRSQKTQRDVQKTFHELATKGFVENFETAFMRENGEVFPVEMNMSLLRNKVNDVSGTVITVRDITERKHLEEERWRTKRLEAVSELASGIACDFDSILTALLGNIINAQAAMGLDDETYGYLAEAEKGAMRAKDMIKQLITFSSESPFFKRQHNIGEVLTEITTQVFKGTNILCEFSIDHDLWPLSFDREMISQVLRSLLANEQQAMPDGGVIRITASNVLVDEKMKLPIASGKYVKLTVQDQGIGILNEYIQDIFSTYLKQGRKRSGMVLATAYSIIKKHNGLITVEAEFGGGTTFIIYLPADNGHA